MKSMQDVMDMGWAGCEILRERTIDSTNARARRWIREGAPHGAVVVAAEQTAGRGRRGRDWVSRPGDGLWLSIVLRPSMEAAFYPLLALGAALAAADACGEASGIAPRIKWPNDLIAGGHKVCGILLEREGDAVALGIGINVRQRLEDFPPELRGRAGSLEMAAGYPVDMGLLERRLLANIERRVDQPDFLPEYMDRCATVGARVRVEGVDDSFDGRAEAVDASGALMVRDAQGVLRRVLAGDVSVRGMMGYV